MKFSTYALFNIVASFARSFPKTTLFLMLGLCVYFTLHTYSNRAKQEARSQQVAEERAIKREQAAEVAARSKTAKGIDTYLFLTLGTENESKALDGYLEGVKSLYSQFSITNQSYTTFYKRIIDQPEAEAVVDKVTKAQYIASLPYAVKLRKQLSGIQAQVSSPTNLQVLTASLDVLPTSLRKAKALETSHKHLESILSSAFKKHTRPPPEDPSQLVEGCSSYALKHNPKTVAIVLSARPQLSLETLVREHLLKEIAEIKLKFENVYTKSMKDRNKTDTDYSDYLFGILEKRDDYEILIALEPGYKLRNHLENLKP